MLEAEKSFSRREWEKTKKKEEKKVKNQSCVFVDKFQALLLSTNSNNKAHTFPLYACETCMSGDNVQ